MASSLHLLAALIYLLPFWIHATPFLHASSFPAPLVRRQPPEIPTNIRGLVVNLLEDCPEALRELGLVCREFNDLTRPILFRNIHILSTNCLVELAALLESTWSTIPRNARNLIIHFDPPSFHGYRVEKQNSETIAIALTDIIIHFDIQRSAFLSFPGVFSRLLDWSYLGRWVNLRSLSVHGHYGYVAELTTTLAQLPLLESLVVSATFTSSTPSANLLASAGPPAFYNFLSPRLREITIASPGSLCLIPWMCSVGVGPENLHLLRVRVDNFDRHSNYFTHILPFLQRYGKQLTHLYAWLDDTLDSEMRVGEARSPSLRDALQHAPRLRQLELMLPDAFREYEVARYTNVICKHVLHSTSVRVRGGYFVGVDEAEFWEPPMPCGQRLCALRAAHR